MQKIDVDKIQSSVTHWVEVVKKLHQELIDCDNSGKEFTRSRALAEHKGRIYAARQLADILGIKIDSSYLD